MSRRALLSPLTPPRLAKGRWVPLAVGLALMVALAGCTAGSDAADPLEEAKAAIESGDLVLYLNVTAGEQTYRFSSDDPTNVPQPQPPNDLPMNVTVTLEAKGLPDSGEDVAWAFDWDDEASADAASGNSTASGNASADADAGRMQPGSIQGFGDDLPASFSHQFARPGLHHLQFGLTVLGEKVESVTAPLNVGGGAKQAVQPGTVLGSDAFSAEGSLPFSPSLGGQCASDGTEEFPWSFNATYNETPAEVQRVLLQLDAAGGSAASLALVDANGTVVAEEQASGGQATLDASGPFQAGSYLVRVQGCAVADGGFTVDGEATYVAAAVKEPGSGSPPT